MSFHNIAIATRDMLATHEFYTDAMGFELVRAEKADMEGGVWAKHFFYDTGNVYRDVSDYDLGDLRHVAGVGIRLTTPVGPLRIEYGRKLDRETREESLGEFFFSIGQAF